jgi:hypothetical protein
VRPGHNEHAIHVVVQLHPAGTDLPDAGRPGIAPDLDVSRFGSFHLIDRIESGKTPPFPNDAASIAELAAYNGAVSDPFIWLQPGQKPALQGVPFHSHSVPSL